MLGLGCHILSTGLVPLVAKYSAHLGSLLLEVHVSLGLLLCCIGSLLRTLGGAGFATNRFHRGLVLAVSGVDGVRVVVLGCFQRSLVVVVASIEVVVEALESRSNGPLACVEVMSVRLGLSLLDQLGMLGHVVHVALEVGRCHFLQLGNHVVQVGCSLILHHLHFEVGADVILDRGC